MPEGATMMHEMSLDRLNGIIASAEQSFAEIEDRAQEYGRATYEGARRVEEWARGIIEQDNEYSSLFVTKVDEINGTSYACLRAHGSLFVLASQP